MAQSDSPSLLADSQAPQRTQQAAPYVPASLGEALDLQRPMAAAATPSKGSPPSAAFEAIVSRNRANLLSELRSLSGAQLVTVDAAEKKARLEDSIRTKRRRHDSEAAAADTAAGPDSSAAAAAASGEAEMEHDQHVLTEESVVDVLDENDDSDVVTIVTISTPARSPAPSRRTPPTVSVNTVVVPPMAPEDEADLRVLRAQGLVTAALRERSSMHAAAPATGGRDAELLQSLRQDRRVTGLLGQTAFVRTLEASLQNRPASGAMRTPLRRRAPSGLVSEQPSPSAAATAAPAARVPPTDPRLNAEIENEIVLLTRAAPVTRMLQSEQRQVLEILIRTRIERQGRAPARANPAGVLLRQAHRMRDQPGQQRREEQEAAPVHTTAAAGAGAGANNVTISVLQAQIRIMTEQMAEMARMVTATYQLQQDMQRTMNQQVAAVFHTFQAQAEYAQAAAAAPAAAAASLHFPAPAHAHAAPAPAAAATRAPGEAGAGGVSLGNCVICSQQVDSVLYRCGHMCVCGLCARQLKAQDQWCPMCRAPIDDIVRVYPN
eukprot:m.17137 g.17137  ORF g.17137 m.17137 type:complete len:549 (+) comp7050_c0_seq2:124-1770(+)